MESVPDGAPDLDPLLRGRVEHAMAALTSMQRATFVLVHLEGFSVSEAANMLGVASGTAKSHLHRALVALRASLGDVQDGGDHAA